MGDYTLRRNQDQTDTVAEAMQASSGVVARLQFMRVHSRGEGEMVTRPAYVSTTTSLGPRR